MSAPPYMKLYVGDYLGDTHHLGVTEHGAYLLLLMAMWRAGGSLPSADANLAKLARCTPDQWAEIRESVLPYFRRRGGRITHKRVAEEIAKYESTSGKRSEAGKRGAVEKARKNSDPPQAKASAAESNCIHNQNQNQKEVERANALFVAAEKPSPKTHPLVETLWACQPICGGKRKATRPEVAKALSAALKRGGLPDQIEAAFRSYYALPDCTRDGGQYAKGAAVLLNDDKWRDFLPQNAGRIGDAWPESRWRVAVQLWTADGSWSAALGPVPGDPGCRVSPEIQREFGIEPAKPQPVRATA